MIDYINSQHLIFNMYCIGLFRKVKKLVIETRRFGYSLSYDRQF